MSVLHACLQVADNPGRQWCKMSNLELGTRTPLIIRAPFMANSTGKTTAALAEIVDLCMLARAFDFAVMVMLVFLIDPTLSDLAGLSLPGREAGGEYLGGQSLKPVFENPDNQVCVGYGGMCAVPP